MKLKFRADFKDIISFLILCVVLLYLVAIAVLNLKSVSQDGYIWGLNPFPAFGPDYIFATLLFFAVTLAAIMASCSSYFFEREEGFGITTEKKSKADGYTKVWDAKDMKKDYGIKKIHLQDDSYSAGGFPVINDGVNAWVDDGENHSLIMGASGSGKSQSFMFPLIRILAKHGESMIVTDPKGELYEGCGNLLKEKGYRLILVNFRDPSEGSAWNPFSYPYRIYKEGNVDKANELLQDLASNILIDPNNRQEPFWETTASNFFTGLALGLFDDATEEQVNINSINIMAETGEDRLGASTYIKEYFKSKGELSPAYIAAASCINAPNETRGGIMSTFRTKTRIFSSQQQLSEMLSYSDFDIRDIGKAKTAVFLKIHDEKTTYHALATIFVKQVYEALIAVAQTCPNIRLPFRTNFVLDEFANMPALKDVESMITASRSRNIRFSFVIQNFSQLNKVYGKEVAETIKGNCGNFVYLMSTELAALEEISKLLGDKKPKKAKKDEQQEPIRPLFSVSDLQALKQGEVIINRFRSMPFKTKLTFDYKIDWGKKYDKMGYTQRTHREVQVFNLKEFVNKLKQEQGALPGGMGGAPRGLNSPFNPYAGGIPNNSPYENNNSMSNANPFAAGAMPTNLDDYVKRLDEKIAELEAEEAAENEKNKQNTNNQNNIESQISDIFDHKTNEAPVIEKEPIEKEPIEKITNESNIESFEELNEEPKIETFKEENILPKEETNINNDVLIKPNPIVIDTTSEILEEKPSNRIIDNNSVAPESFDVSDATTARIDIPQSNQTEDVEKPKVNVNVNDIPVKNNVSNEDFFDDFFGSEDE